MSNFKDIMIDTETVDSATTTAILSIGAVSFDIETGAIGEKFYIKIDKDTGLALGLTQSEQTMKWWAKQSEEAREEAFSGTEDTTEALKKLNRFIKKFKKPRLWSNGKEFDLALLKYAMNKANITPAWKFYQEMDVRTLDNLFPQVRRSMKFSGTAHNAVDDCIQQVKYTSKIFQIMNENGSASDEDGETHINVYSKGTTLIGKWLSNFAHTPITLPEDGEFDSIEAYWYWLQTKDDSLRKTYGYDAKAKGKALMEAVEVKVTDEEWFKEKIKQAIDIKLKSNLTLFGQLCASKLPLRHYYVYGNKRVDAGYEWILKHIEMRRNQMREHLLKQK